MAPIKFEENIREKLQERELEPSKESWDVLSKKLGHTQAPKTNRRLWMAVAAGFMGLLLVVSYMLTSIEEAQPVQLVDEVMETPSELKEERSTPLSKDTPDIAITENAVENNQNTNSSPLNKIEPEFIPKSETAVAKSKQTPDQTKEEVQLPVVAEKEAIAKVITIPNEKSTEAISKEDLFVTNKVDAVVAAVREMEAGNAAVTAEEINILLSKAQRDIATNRILKSGTAKIDPSSLLQDVEREMERSFRDKVFEALGEGYNKVRTAVAERNN